MPKPSAHIASSARDDSQKLSAAKASAKSSENVQSSKSLEEMGKNASDNAGNSSDPNEITHNNTGDANARDSNTRDSNTRDSNTNEVNNEVNTKDSNGDAKSKVNANEINTHNEVNEVDISPKSNSTNEDINDNNTTNNNNPGIGKSVKKKKRRSKARKSSTNAAKSNHIDSAKSSQIDSAKSNQIDSTKPDCEDTQSRHHYSTHHAHLPKPAPPGSLKSSNSPLSPRKQAIMRYKKSDDQMNGHNLISEAKENMKNKRRSPPATSSPTDEDDKYSTLLSQQNMEGKASLFKFASSKILVYHEQLNDDNSESQLQASGRLLGHGEFEVFQLHNGDVTYLSCGPSFVYPLLPKLKILRIASNQFILPLVNPERYWKIFINSDDASIIQSLENSLKGLVQYRNLFLGPNQVAWNTSINIKDGLQDHENENTHNQDKVVKLNAGTNSNPALEINLKPSELKTSSIKDEISVTESHVLDDEINERSIEVSEIDENKGYENNDKLNTHAQTDTGHLNPKTIASRTINTGGQVDCSNLLRTNEPRPSIGMYGDIPESPPSLPMSPQPLLDADHTEFSISKPVLRSDLATGLSFINRQDSMNSITSAMASFDISNTAVAGNTSATAIAPLHTQDKLHNKAVTNSAKSRSEVQRHNHSQTSAHPRLHDIAEQKLSQAEPDVSRETSPQTYKKIHHPKPTKGTPRLQAQNQFTTSPAKGPHRYHHDVGQGSTKQQPEWYNSNIDDTRSESSMDSLLDEYEEHLSVSKSMTFTRSRPPSRSVSERHDFNNISNYQLKSWNLRGGPPNILGNLESSDLGEEDADPSIFPSTSLSEYNKTRANNVNYNSSNRSRRSSHSELYTSVSNWMEPGTQNNNRHATQTDSQHRQHLHLHSSQPTSRPPVGKAYSVSNGYREPGKESGQLLNNTYHHIYKSITQRNLSSILNEDDQVKSRPARLQYDQPKPVKMASQSSLRRKGSYAGSLVGMTPSRTSAVNPVDVYDNLLYSQHHPHQHQQYHHSRQLNRPQSRARSGSRASEYSHSPSLANLHNYSMMQASKPRASERAGESSGTKSKTSRKAEKMKGSSKSAKGFTSKLFGW